VQDSGAYGWDGGFGSSWLVDPNHDLVVIVLTERMFESPEAPRVHGDVQAAGYAALASPAAR
jgi:CubicO group peptidase (beta-lactamase class C family)